MYGPRVTPSTLRCLLACALRRKNRTMSDRQVLTKKAQNMTRVPCSAVSGHEVHTEQELGSYEVTKGGVTCCAITTKRNQEKCTLYDKNVPAGEEELWMLTKWSTSYPHHPDYPRTIPGLSQTSGTTRLPGLSRSGWSVPDYPDFSRTILDYPSTIPDFPGLSRTIPVLSQTFPDYLWTVPGLSHPRLSGPTPGQSQTGLSHNSPRLSGRPDFADFSGSRLSWTTRKVRTIPTWNYRIFWTIQNIRTVRAHAVGIRPYPTLRNPTLRHLKEGRLQVQLRGQERNIFHGHHEAITEQNWWEVWRYSTMRPE